MQISNRTLLIVICVTLFVLLLLCTFIVGTYVSYHVMKWLNINIKNKLYFDTYKHGTETILNKYGDLPIKRVYLIRRNIDSLLHYLLDILTWRSYSTQLRELRKKINDNTFFPNHTCLMVEVELQDDTRKILMIEKTNGVNVDYVVDKGQRIVQLCPPDLSYPLWVVLVDTEEELGVSERGTGGFGSTGA